MEFENKDEIKLQYKKNHTCKCEECGYVWVEEITIENDNFFDDEEEREYFCPMCGGSYLNKM